MDTKAITLTIIALFGWGFGTFIAKLATNRIGSVAIFWDMVGFTVVTVIYALIVFKPEAFAVSDHAGVWYAALSGIVGAAGSVAFYLLMVQKDASVVAPLTALYPALTAILGILFLKESITPIKVFGIALATFAVYLLSL
jgi:transporter family protein